MADHKVYFYQVPGKSKLYAFAGLTSATEAAYKAYAGKPIALRSGTGEADSAQALVTAAKAEGIDVFEKIKTITTVRSNRLPGVEKPLEQKPGPGNR